MNTINDVHLQFAAFFESPTLRPFAYLVSRKLGEGHICLNLDTAVEEVNALTFIDEPIASLPDWSQERFVSCNAGAVQPFVLHNNKLYLHRYFTYETWILQSLHALIAAEGATYAERLGRLELQKDLIATLFYPNGAPGDVVNWQAVAAVLGCLHNFTILTGGPGTGKTTTVAKILAVLFSINPDLKVALAAPTGKAAARMTESLNNIDLPVTADVKARFAKIKPSTIHRLLQYRRNSTQFAHNAANKLIYDVVIIDESSMIDMALFAKLLVAIAPGTRLLLLGDKDQLASVEAGSLFGDLCTALPALNRFDATTAEVINAILPDNAPPLQPVATAPHLLQNHIIELRHSHRFSSDKGIGKLSNAIISNNIATITSFFGGSHGDDEVSIDPTYSDAVFNDFIEGYAAYISEPDTATALRRLADVRVLCAVRQGNYGLHALNKRIEDRLHKKKLIVRSGEFYINRPIIVTKNSYALGLYNGDVGIIRGDGKGGVRAWFDDGEGGLKSVLPGYIAHLDTVFAMTIHKSQGSEFGRVLLQLPRDGGNQLLTRELLYTAVTRAKHGVVIQSDEQTILDTCTAKVQRGSGILSRFSEGLFQKTATT